MSPKIQTEKCLVSFLWSLTGIQRLADGPKWSTYDSAFFCDPVMPMLVDEICLHPRRKSFKGRYIHLDNAPPRISSSSTETLRERRLKRVSRPVSSPDLAPSAFLLFVYLKQQRMHSDIHDRESLKNAITRNIRRSPASDTHNCLRDMKSQAELTDRTQRQIL
jgi:hypothetical protein